jgi:hypothetical protein
VEAGDGCVIDGFGPDGIASRVQDITGRVVKLQTGYLYHYAFVMLIGIAALVTWMMLGRHSDDRLASSVSGHVHAADRRVFMLPIKDDTRSARRNIRQVALLDTASPSSCRC